MKVQTNFFIVVISLFLLLSVTYGQEYGKIYSKSEADNLFGKVMYSESFSKTEIQEFLTKTENVIMFRFEGDNLTILGDNRTLIYSETSYLEKNEKFHVFSKSKVSELLNLSKESKCFVQQREEVLTLTCDDVTLELSEFCPPFCD